ncbi:neuronal acetylcholine receptor subunit alpha-7-like [Saccostrea cucullata]|uniref:neuronal acetylcholine receptor subunit alpha-7-like n=1 Tax=Saccostrea cuccullata TaxID=36930 RepID=UPI002ED48221
MEEFAVMIGCLFLSALMRVTACTYMEEESTLQMELLTGYNFNVRPTSNGTEKTVIGYDFYIKSINDFKEAEGKLSLTGALSVYWRDPRLSWSTSLPPYDKINSTSFKSFQVWTPSFILSNAFGSFRRLGVESGVVHFSSTGFALMHVADMFEAKCLSDVRSYPFDVQRCQLEIVPWDIEATTLKIISQKEPVSLQYYTMSGLWDIENTHTYVLPFPLFDQITVSVEIKRRTLYHVILLMIPLCILSILPTLVFLIPVESGERMGYSTTSLLSLLLYQTAIASKLPESSIPGLSLLILKTFAEFLLACIILIMSVYAIKFYYYDENTPIPKPMIFLNWIMARKKENVIHTKKVQSEPENESKVRTVWKEEPRITWQDLSHSFDKFCLLFSISIFIGVNIVFLVLINTPK